MNHDTIKEHCQQSVANVYPSLCTEDLSIVLQPTRDGYEGDITWVVFPLAKPLRQKPQLIGERLGEAIVAKFPTYFSAYEVVGGFVNLSYTDHVFTEMLQTCVSNHYTPPVHPIQSTQTTVIEYSSPNTNKPLHLGHIRNNLLGYAISNILSAVGHQIKKVQIINDRGIHICKSMLAWQRSGLQETPESTGIKGDKLVGKYYVMFEKMYRQEIKDMVENGTDQEEAEADAPILLSAKDMLRDWEQGVPEVVALWKQMNSWVYEGFEKTYTRMGVDFDKLYYESDTYLLGKKMISHGLTKGIFYQKNDGSVWIDLTDEGFDHKILLRSDGTAVYMTQDLGTAVLRQDDFSFDQMVYTVGSEQDYHFSVLFEILKKLDYTWADKLYHLSYGMVNLPSGKMKSREGAVVDADPLMQQMYEHAKEVCTKLGKLEGYSDEQKKDLYEQIGQAALKYHMLKVDPRQDMLFDPEQSIDFNGTTGPFIQYTHARIQSLLSKADDNTSIHPNHDNDTKQNSSDKRIDEREKNIIKKLISLDHTIHVVIDQLSPAIIAGYAYKLAKVYNTFYQNVPVLTCADSDIRMRRIELSRCVATTLSWTMNLLGISMPDRM